MVLPFRPVAPLRQQVHAAQDIAGIEVLGIDPRQQRHILVLRPQRRRDHPGTLRLHVVEQPADEIGDQIRSQRPTRPEISENPDHVRHAGEHHPAVCHGIGKYQRLIVYGELDIAQDIEIEPGGRDDDVGGERPYRTSEECLFR